ncbi:HD domain-containing protein [Proteinivorax hydrogeniformans]|uniref:HD domain-containing protein n=1 Tax=Proteinivorax hydrogeniformans TaxID=1826727 RepID=A0AAU8HV82_9FIRM
MLYRVKQFFKSFNAKVSEKEINWIRNNLTASEQKIFFKLPTYEQRHSIDVALTVKERTGQLDERQAKLLIRAALLHDVGKINTGLNPITKSISVIFDIFNKQKKVPKKPRFLQGYYLHPYFSVEILKNEGIQDEELLYLIGNHHNNTEIEKNYLLKVLMDSDGEN